MPDAQPPQSSFVLYQTEDGETRIQCRFDVDTIWLTQAQIAELFQTTPQNVTIHLKSIYAEGELTETESCKDYLQVRLEGQRKVSRSLRHYSSDYQAREEEAQRFFAEVQNKLLYAATRHTAAELIVARADPAQPNMALTTWSGSRLRKHDVIVAKNYLSEDEVDTLNRLVVIFLEQAELRAKQHKELTLDYWRGSVDRMLSVNDQSLLQGLGRVSHEEMKTIAAVRYGEFDATRRRLEAQAAEDEDLKAIESLERKIKRKGKKT